MAIKPAETAGAAARRPALHTRWTRHAGRLRCWLDVYGLSSIEEERENGVARWDGNGRGEVEWNEAREGRGK